MTVISRRAGQLTASIEGKNLRVCRVHLALSYSNSLKDASGQDVVNTADISMSLFPGEMDRLVDLWAEAKRALPK